MRNIPDDVIAEVSSSVIGYGRKHRDNTVMKYYTEYSLPLAKVKNRYMITESNLAIWLEKHNGGKTTTKGYFVYC